MRVSCMDLAAAVLRSSGLVQPRISTPTRTVLRGLATALALLPLAGLAQELGHPSNRQPAATTTDTFNSETASRTTAIISDYAGKYDYPGGFSGDGGPATKAEMHWPWGVAFDGAGNLYITDRLNFRVRKVDKATGIITTVAGNGTEGYSGDGGLATEAELSEPVGIAADSSGNLYINDSENNVIRKVTASTGIITTFAGNGDSGYYGDGGPATSAGIGAAQGLILDALGDLYIAEVSGIRKITAATQTISTVAGVATGGTTGCAEETDSLGDGCLATLAVLSYAEDMALDASGNLYIADANDSTLFGDYPGRVRKVSASSGIITTIAGGGRGCMQEVDDYGDNCPATSAFLQPNLGGLTGIALDSSGNVYVAAANFGPYVVRVINATTQVIQVAAGTISEPGYSGDGGPAIDATLGLPLYLRFDPSGNLYIPDYFSNEVRKVTYSNSGISTITTLTSSLYTSTFPQPVTFTATVKAASGPAPKGNVTFKSGVTWLGEAALAEGVANLTTTALPVGTDSITAIYEGDSTDAGSTSPVLKHVVK